jgi:hypothetical protein
MLQSNACRALIAFLVGAALTPTVTRAQPVGEVYRVSDIPVDVTASDAVTARAQALVEGQRAGLDRLLRRLVPADEQGGLPPVGSLPIEPYIQNFEIANEELSSTRYLAELTVRYDPEAVRTLLESEALSFAEMASAPILVLPLYETPEGARVWPDDNPLWQAWAEELDPERLLRLVLPLGDLEDMAMVTPEQVRAGEPGPLQALAARYGSEDVLVAAAHPIAAEPAPAVELTMQRIGDVAPASAPETLRGRPGQTEDELLAQAVRGLQDSLDERWKRANLLRFDQAGIMVVDVPITRLGDWVQIDRGLRDLPEVSQVEIASFARTGVRAQIRHIGDQIRLEQAFARLGLELSREGESWLLRPMAGDPGRGEPPSTTSTAY